MNKSYQLVIGFLFVLMCTSNVNAQLPGWQHAKVITIYENSGDDLTNHQVLLTLDTRTLIDAGEMNPDGSDIRFATAYNGSSLIDYWIENYINTDSTKIWVKPSSIPANGSITIIMFYGNPLATSVSDIEIFEGPYSGNNYLTGGSPGGSGNRQRGFFFRGSRDILVTQFGKYEPNGTTRYVTLFDSISQVLMEQIHVSGPAATLSYSALSNPIWLNRNQSYLISVFLSTGDQYYISSSTQAGPYLTYTRTGWCNTCTENTFPLNGTTGHFGYPDFEYYVRDYASAYPTFTINDIAVNSTAPGDVFNYQAVLRDTNGIMLSNQMVDIRVSLLADSVNGTNAYQEIHQTTSNEFGLISLAVGSGNAVFGVWSLLEWESRNYYIKMELDTSGGSNYLSSGTTLLKAVPRALYAKMAGATPAWSLAGNTLFNSTENIGIGTSNAERALHISDVIRIEPRSAAPQNPAKGDIYMDDVDNKLKVFDGTQWQSCW